jgi:SagB-type dehydrogenase family enzyme
VPFGRLQQCSECQPSGLRSQGPRPKLAIISCVPFVLLDREDYPLPDPEPNPPRPGAVSEKGVAVDSIAIALSYHQQTKHHLHRYARSLGYLDWATQPNPFRTFEGTKAIELPLAADGLHTAYGDLFTPSAIPAQPLELKSIGVLFELALGLAAWKEFQGNRWALRCNPSSGNLHPTEGYAILPTHSRIEAGVYHYASRDHCLERRCSLDDGAVADLTSALPTDSFLVGLSSIHWPEAWKYGERAFRYCLHDVGHAIATVRYAAATLGWSALLLDSPSDDDVAAVLGLDRVADFDGVDAHDRENPAALIVVSRQPTSGLQRALPIETLRGGHWLGQANQLSPSHVDWDVIDDAVRATWKPTTDRPERDDPMPLPPLASVCRTSAATLIRQRRSCQALDGQTAISAEVFYGMLDHLLPRPGVPPWDALSWLPQLHVGIFVHRITGLAPGLYLLERDQAVHDRLHAALKPTFQWDRLADCPEHLRLFCLTREDLRHTAQAVSCHQDIAADGAFSLGMIADFTPAIRAHGAWWYRRLFWEAGVLGQVLYLEAEAAGVRSTGIGCYFDDAFHELLGLTGDEFQDLYHFTVGAPIEDHRLMTLPAYSHLHRS